MLLPSKNIQLIVFLQSNEEEIQLYHGKYGGKTLKKTTVCKCVTLCRKFKKGKLGLALIYTESTMTKPLHVLLKPLNF